MSAIDADLDLGTKSGRVATESPGGGTFVVTDVRRSNARVRIGTGPYRAAPRSYAGVLVVASDPGEHDGWGEEGGRTLSFVPVIE